MSDSNRRSGNRSGLAAGGSAVQRLVSQAQEQQAQAEDLAAGRTGKGRPANAGQVGRDKTRRAKITLDLPLSQQQALRSMAEAEDVSLSDLAGLAIARLLADIEAGRLDLEPMKTPARSLKAAWKLQHTEKGEAVKKTTR